MAKLLPGTCSFCLAPQLVYVAITARATQTQTGICRECVSDAAVRFTASGAVDKVSSALADWLSRKR